ncbi:TolC family protein [Raineya orbicola]|jgi:NodT family efflux transporter outer membrane factor (OMF) lipoprotein|uniref:Efflux transporter, outer membrane factor (OMF) lipoprotein, NodT family n=1 Tax=Raineya orbicola TaxID=2016530 RepID=A0A2N3IDJ3_9BACT|nr:TolC family protein [Raineya orbicola]PKQ68303.1 Efflux transporter, outer membrane factor (OMF) lipoprotein, NodT family [Raineya orbicola]
MNLKKYCFWAVLLLAFSCQRYFAPIQEPLKIDIPQNFVSLSQDTNSVALLKWQDFFQDDELENLIAIALQNNRDLQIALQRIEKAKAEYLYTKGILLPNVRFHASAGADKFGDFTMNGVGNFDTNLSGNIGENQRIPTNPTTDLFVGLRSSWEIDIWTKLRSSKKAQQARILASQEYKNLITTELVVQIATLYYQILALDSELEVVVKNIQLQEQVLALMKTQKEAGKATELAVQQTQAQLYRTRSLKFLLENQITDLENQINFLCGRVPQKIARSQNLLEKTIPTIRIGTPLQMLRLRPDVRLAERQLAAARLDLRSAQAAFLPSLNIDAYAGLNAFRGNVLFSSASIAYGILGGLTAPIFQNNALKANYKVNLAQNYEAYFEYQKTVLRAFQEIQTFQKILANLQQVYELRNKEVEELQKAIITSQDLFKTGFANYLEVITTQKAVLEAEIDLFEIRLHQFQYVIALYRALGGGWQ